MKVWLLSRVSTIDQERFCLNLPCCELATDVLIQEVVNYSDPTQSKPPLVHPADLKFYTLSTLRQHVKQFEVLRAFLNGSIDHEDVGVCCCFFDYLFHLFD